MDILNGNCCSLKCHFKKSVGVYFSPFHALLDSTAYSTESDHVITVFFTVERASGVSDQLPGWVTCYLLFMGLCGPKGYGRFYHK